MITSWSCRSSALSTSVTSAGASSSPHGVRLPNDSFIHRLYSARLLFATSAPASSNTQCRGNPEAPVIALSCVPSAWIVSSRVVQTIGAEYWMNGGRLTARGIGAPVRPPTVWVNRTEVEVTSGSPCRSGSGVAGTVIEVTPSPTVVAPIIPPPQYPKPVIRPSSTSMKARSSFAKRKRSAMRRSSTAAWTSVPRESGGGGSWCAIFIRVATLPIPSNRSEGIHEMVLTLRSIRMFCLLTTSGRQRAPTAPGRPP